MTACQVCVCDASLTDQAAHASRHIHHHTQVAVYDQIKQVLLQTEWVCMHERATVTALSECGICLLQVLH